MSTYSPTSGCEPIALIGIGCRFPGNVQSPQAFWELLLHGTDAVTEVPEGRWDLRRYYHPDPDRPGTMHTRHGAFLERIDGFDASFFGIAPLEASRMDPQQRLLLEVSWEALEDAGAVPQALTGSATGVFVGICFNDYQHWQKQYPTEINAYSNAGGAMSIAANRLSYFFDWHGPSLSVDTACSSALVAVHLACQSLWKGECPLALAGGVNLLLDPTTSVGFSKAHMLSPSGRCHSFDARADGYVRGEGVGVIVLKPLKEALADHDPIYAVIRGTGVNQSGHTSSLHYPGRTAQASLLRQVYAEARIAPESVQYIEAHGTGTLAGDMVECEAIGEVFAPSRPMARPLRIGSVKSNIGHLEGASGIAGLIKAALIARQRQIPANLHFQTPNPQISFSDLRLKVQQDHEIIAPSDDPFIVGVNNFGFGGTNAHIILQAFDEVNHTVTTPVLDQRLHVLPLSARSPQALHALATTYLAWLDREDVPTLEDLCFTASQRREQHRYRLALVMRSHADLREKLEAFLAKEMRPEVISGQASDPAKNGVAFVFSGNGPQWWGMGRQLLACNPLFRSVIERCDQHLQPLTGWSLLEELHADAATSRIDQTEVAQPALFALQIALAEVLKSWGIEPQVVIGHSVGEIAAAYVADILSFEDAIQVVYHRSRLQERTAGHGCMLAVGISASQAESLLVPYHPRVSLASINAPEAVTLAGDADALDEIVTQLVAQGVFCRFLKLNYAFHHQSMDTIQHELKQSLQALQPRNGRLAFISTVTGNELAGSACDAEYWWKNVRNSVQFAAGIARIKEDGLTTFLEIGPHPVLKSYIVDCLGDSDGHVLSSLRRQENEEVHLLKLLGSLYTQGYPIAWKNVHPTGRHVNLPPYSWQQERYWLETPSDVPQAHGTYIHPLLGNRLALAQPTWENSLGNHELSYLHDHQVEKVALFPATGYIEMCLAAATDLFGKDTYTLNHLSLQKALFLNNERATTIQATCSPEDLTVQISVKTQEEWTLHASGQIARWQPPQPPVHSIPLLRSHCPREITAADFYAACHRIGFHYLSAFQLVERVFIGKQEALGIIHQPLLPENGPQEYFLHPALLDCCLHVFIASLMVGEHEERVYLPVEMQALNCYTQNLPAGPLYSYVRQTSWGPQSFTADFSILDGDGTTLIEVIGLRVQATSSGQGDSTHTLTNDIYTEAWMPVPLHPQYSQLPSPISTVARLQQTIHALSQDSSIRRFQEQALPQINRICVASVLEAFHQLGWSWTVGEHVHVGALCKRLGVLEHYERWLTIWCMILEEEGMLQQTNDGWIVTRSSLAYDLPELLRTGLRDLPENHLEMLMIFRCRTHLADILTGKVDPLSVLFVEGDFSVLEQFYTNELMARAHNHLVQKTLIALLEQLPKDRVLRILELGAGTGGTTSYLLPLLPAERTMYVFSDVSEALLQLAQQKFQTYPFVEYRLLNLEGDPSTQGFEEHYFDLIIASNVLHATTSIRNSLAHVRQLLGSQGWLSLIELTNPRSRLNFFTFGLLDGFWAFQDRELRLHSPLLDETGWQSVLAQEKFTEVSLLSPCPHIGQSEQSVFLAQGPLLRSTPQEASEVTATTWLVFADEQGLTRRLQDVLADKRLILVSKGAEYQRLATDHFQLCPQAQEDLQCLLNTLEREAISYDQIVYLWGLDTPEGELSPTELQIAVDTCCVSVFQLFQELLATHAHSLPALRVVTSQMQQLLEEQGTANIAQAPLYGLVRVFINEHPELFSSLIDISSSQQRTGSWISSLEEIRALVSELQSRPDEREVLLRGGSRFVNRIVRAPLTRSLRTTDVAQLPDTAFRLETSAPGTLDHLELHTVPRRKPEPEEVEIAVSVAGLNFKDVALAMGLLPAEKLETHEEYALGLECAGTIVAVGEGVEHLHPGDEVMALGRHSFGSFVTTPACGVIRKPADLTMEDAAGVMCVFLTAHYALHHLARIRNGERVLIHSAAGGVGLAAIQIAQQAGAEIFATAGTVEKRAYLCQLGVQHVLDSRSLDFADEIMRLTDQEGIDIVLNSLAGEASGRSLNLLRAFGRFLEIGKRDLVENKKLGLYPFQRCLSYYSIDLLYLLQKDRSLLAVLAQQLAERFEQGIYRPLPYQLFQLSQMKQAFRSMQQSRHIGKLLIAFQHQQARVLHKPELQPATFREDATYLISGGVSGFGLATAQWLVEQGARHLVICSRSGTPSLEDAQTIADLQATGVQILVLGTDITQEEAVAALMHRIEEQMPPLRGIIHAAVVYDDRPVQGLDAASWSRVLAPKMLGAWNLHQQTRHLALDFFVAYSSVSSLVCNRGQANYVAGNMFLEALARYRQAQKQPALTVAWGTLGQVGYVAQHAEVLEHLIHIGLPPMDHHQALLTLGKVMQDQERCQACITLCNWNVLDAAWSDVPSRARWMHLLSQEQNQPGQEGQPQASLASMLQEMTPIESQQTIFAHLQRTLGHMLGKAPVTIESQQVLINLGLDSLMAMELRNRVKHDLGIDIPVMQILRPQSITDLVNWMSQHIVEKAVSTTLPPAQLAVTAQ